MEASRRRSVPTDGVLRSRLLPPRLPPDCLPRDRLVAEVVNGLRGRLVAVVAGAGYGKTTLLAQALAESELPWVWCACDARLAEARSLLVHVAGGIRERFPGFGAALRLEGDAAQMVTALSNEVLETVPDDFVLALDDVHLLGAPALAVVASLVDDLPPSAHLALAGRAPLPFPLARLRALRAVEIDERRLALSAEEVGSLAGAIAGGLEEDQVEELHRRTEGWPAGVILGAQSRVAGDRDIDHMQFDYLAEEVLLRQPEDVQDFLLDTAVLGRFTPALATAVSGRQDAAALCRMLVDGHLFAVRLDDDGDWYRYHHLLQAFLRERLDAREPGRLRDRHMRAARWWSAAGEPGEAVRHLLDAGDPEGAVDELEPVAERMVLTGQGTALAGWLDVIPRPLWADRPALLAAHVGLVLHRAEHESAFAEADAVIGELIGLGDHERAAVALVRLQQAMITAGTRPARRIRSGERFLPRIREDARMLPIARVLLATAYGYGCRFDDARRELAGALELPGAGALPSLGAYVEVARAFYVDLWTGSPHDALATLERAIAHLEAAEPDDPLSFRMFAHILRSYMLLGLGRYEQNLALVALLREEFGRRGLGAVLERSASWVQCTCLAGLGRWEELQEVFEPPPRAADPEDATSYSYRYRSPAALYAAHRGDAGEVQTQLRAAREEMRAFGAAFDDGLFHCDFAVAASAVGLEALAHEQARAAVAAADRIGSPWGHVRAAMVAAHAGEGPGGGSPHLARALELTDRDDLAELWTKREARIAPGLLARAIEEGVGPPGVAASLVACCRGAMLGEILAAAGGADPALRTLVAEAAGGVADADIELVDRLLRDRDQGVREAARRSWMRLKARPRAAITILALGEFTVLRDEVPVAPGTFVRQKARALLACLVAARGPVHREALCDRLWPELPAERAAASLRSALYDLRRAVEPELEAGSPVSIIAGEGDTIRLVLGERDRCDADELERLAAGAGPDDVEALRAAEALYRGDFAPDWPYEDWAMPRREELRETFKDVVARLAEALVEAGEPSAAILRFRRLVALEPEREAWHRALMRAHAAAGERALALRQYHACRTVLRREQGIEPDRETRALYAELLREEAEPAGATAGVRAGSVTRM
jgi:DNA-binding SARP family transcriptional activator